MADFDRLTLRTGRLLLRPLRAADAPAIFAMRSDPKVMRYTSSLPLVSLDQAEAFVARETAGMAAGESLRLGLQRLADDTLIGTCILFHRNAQCRRAEVGYELRHDAWGQGYMHEALQTFLHFGFTELKLNRLEADIDPRNVASARSLERLGFAREGLLRERWIVDGEVSDSALYGLLLSDWKARQVRDAT
ncbi:MAG TPA: GNAT family N-acetyltransferase [Rhodanobacteraceae bacterium]|jgi:RimJ/RimL family protein N-acetyltransferase|nr:GNAT family N-acetyltransferase [Rhodanobacteraceae bacterium]